MQYCSDYTPEQEAEAKRIIELTDYYEILKVKKTSTDQEIKKAYKIVCLSLDCAYSFSPFLVLCSS